MKLLEIADATTYKAADQSDVVLADDFRIIASWYATLKRTGNFKYTEDQIFDIAKDIAGELVKRGKTEFHPEEWEEYSDELYSWVFMALSDEGIQIPANVIEYLNEAKIKESYDESLDEGVRPAFGSPGGKRLLAKTIVSYIPEHKIYAEPFIGGGTVFLKKKLSEVEIINDSDSGIISAFKFMQEGNFSGLNKYKVDGNREHFDKLKNSNPVSALDRFYRFLYLKHFSFGNVGESGGFAPSRGEGSGYTLADKFDKKLPRISERLKGVKIYNKDFRKIIEDWDGDNTFFYLDPPYPDHQGALKTSLTNSDILNSVKNLKARWILSLPDNKNVRETFKDFNIKSFSVNRTFNRNTEHADNEVLVSNFPLKKSDTWLAESVDLNKENDFPQDYAIFVAHFRGKSAHLDFRRMKDGYLEDDAIMIQAEGLIGEDVDTVAKGKKWTKVLLSKGKFRPDMDPNSKVVLVPQEKHPTEWMNARDVAFEPGSPGATKFEPGVIITMDEGMAYPGAQRPDFKEFFLDMKLFKKQRMVERLIDIDGSKIWQTWVNMEDQIPYILSDGQRKDKRDYIPADGEKAIPIWWEEKIPKEMQWWSAGTSDKEKMDKLDAAYNYLISKGDIQSKPINTESVNSKVLDITESRLPLKIKFSDSTYKLICTKNGGLILNKE